jgi:site-specific DNA-cytosine methylase
LYWTNFPISQPDDNGIIFNQIIEQDNREFLPILPWTQKVWGGKKKIDTLRKIDCEKSFCITTSKSHPKNYYISKDGLHLTKLTSIEAERLQTLPEGYTSCISEGKAFKAIGNGWTVDVIAHIFKGLK